MANLDGQLATIISSPVAMDAHNDIGNDPGHNDTVQSYCYRIYRETLSSVLSDTVVQNGGTCGGSMAAPRDTVALYDVLEDRPPIGKGRELRNLQRSK